MSSSFILKPVRRRLAGVLADALELDGFAFTPTQATPGSVFVRPTPGADYIDMNAGTFDAPVAALSAVVVAGVTSWEDSLDWLEGKIELAGVALKDNPTLDGLVDDARIVRVAEPGTIPAGGSSVLAARFDLAPTEVARLETS